MPTKKQQFNSAIKQCFLITHPIMTVFILFLSFLAHQAIEIKCSENDHSTEQVSRKQATYSNPNAQQYARPKYQHRLGAHEQSIASDEKDIPASSFVQSVPFYASGDGLVPTEPESSTTNGSSPLKSGKNEVLSKKDQPSKVISVLKLEGSESKSLINESLEANTSSTIANKIGSSAAPGSISHKPLPVVSILKGNKRIEVPLTLENNLSNNGFLTSADSNGLNDHIEVKHKFTFTVNGRELTLEPPTAGELGAQLASLEPLEELTLASDKGQKKDSNHVAEKGEKKVNRLGEFLSSDYDFGFDLSNDSTETSNSIPIASQQIKQYPSTKNRPISNLSPLSIVSQAPPPSSSSSLMSPTMSRYTSDDYNNSMDNEEAQPSPSMSTMSTTNSARNSLSGNESKAVTAAERTGQVKKRDNDSPGNKIISDWPKASQKSPFVIDRNSTTTPTRTKTSIQNGSKFSTLLSASSDLASVNEASNQSGEQQAHDWGAKDSRINGLIVRPSITKQRQGIKGIVASSLGRQDDEPDKPNTHIKVGVYPRAPVHAKTRYTPVLAFHSVGPGAPISGDKVNNQTSSGIMRPDFEYTNTNTNNEAVDSLDNEGDKHSLILPNNQTIMFAEGRGKVNESTISRARWARSEKSSSFHRPKSRGIISSETTQNMQKKPNNMEQSSKNDEISNEMIIEPPHSMISEYKTNFSTQFNAAKMTNYDLGRFKKPINDLQVDVDHLDERRAKNKSRIVQRDISSRLPAAVLPQHQFFIPASAQLFNRPLRQTFQPSYTTNGNGGPISLNHDINKNVLLLSSTNSTPRAFNAILNESVKKYADKQGLKQMDIGKGGERMNSIVRTGTIVPHPMTIGQSQMNLRALMPTAMALLAQAQTQAGDSRTNQQLRALLAGHHQQLATSQNTAPFNDILMTQKGMHSSVGQNLSGVEQMIATPNQLGVSHLGPQSGMGTSESSNYNSIASLQSYSDSRPSAEGSDVAVSNEPNSGHGPQPSNMMNEDDQRGDYQGQDVNSYDLNSSVRNQNNGANSGANSQPADHITNSRSSISDVYMKAEHKSGDSNNHNSMRSSVDPFEDLTNGIATSEYERDLADLDEEFNRHAGFRRPTGALVSDSIVSLSPERYETQRYNRRPTYDYPAGEYLSAAGSISSIIPRPYQRSPTPSWQGAPSYGDSSDMWTDSSVEFSPLASLINPNHYAYRWRPRYHHQRISPYSNSASYLAASASEQPAYNIIPSYTSAMPTETISLAISPLAAAAAAAASALAAADKTRHHHNHAWTFTLPRLAATNSIAATPTTSGTAASGAHPSTIPASIQTAYMHRPTSPYVLSSVPIYAIAPRPPAPIATAASGATPSILPYYGSPAIIAYRPASVMPTAPLLTAASFAYPLRLPIAAATISPAHQHLRPASSGLLPGRNNVAAGSGGGGLRTFYSDLQFAESKPKLNPTNSSDSKGLVKVSGLTAMAKNLTKKMFGSASQIRPQHVAPPEFLFQNGSLSAA